MYRGIISWFTGHTRPNNKAPLPKNDRLASLMTDKQAFDAYIYTPLQEAISELKRRKDDPALEAYVARMLPNGIPEVMKGNDTLVLFRNIATPNYEISRYMACADVLTEQKPVIFEYTEDAFNDRNEGKHFLGKLRFHKGLTKEGKLIFENAGIINFNESNNKSLSTIQTKWGQPLVDFHHEMFAERFPNFADIVHDLSSWLRLHGDSAKDYYKPFFCLFLRNGILFENFLTNSKEGSFTEKVVLPIFEEIEKECGYRPLIVALEPTNIEDDQFWLSYPFEHKARVDNKSC